MGKNESNPPQEAPEKNKPQYQQLVLNISVIADDSWYILSTKDADLSHSGPIIVEKNQGYSPQQAYFDFLQTYIPNVNAHIHSRTPFRKGIIEQDSPEHPEGKKIITTFTTTQILPYKELPVLAGEKFEWKFLSKVSHAQHKRGPHR